jgi:Cupin domain
MPNTKIIHVGPGEGDAFSAVGDVYRVLASGRQTGNVYALSEIRVSPNNGPPPHIHSREDESFFVLEGEVEFQVGDEKITALPGTFIQGREAFHTVLRTTHNYRRACWRLLPRQDLKISSTNLRNQWRHSIRRRSRLAKTKSINY